MRTDAAKTEFLPHELFFTSANLTSPHRDLESLYEIPTLLHRLYPFRQTVMSVDSPIDPILMTLSAQQVFYLLVSEEEKPAIVHQPNPKLSHTIIIIITPRTRHVTRRSPQILIDDPVIIYHGPIVDSRWSSLLLLLLANAIRPALNSRQSPWGRSREN